MLKYSVVILFLSLCYFSSYGQNEVLEIPIAYQSTFYDNKESLAISNEETGELVLFIEDNKNSKAYLLNKDLKVESGIVFPSLSNTFKNFIGYQINEDKSYSIFFSNNSYKKFGELNLDFSNNKSIISELPFKPKKEVYVESISYKGQFYLMTATKNSNDVSFYKYNTGRFLKNKTVSFEFIQSKYFNGITKKAYHRLVSKGLGSFGSLVKMDINTPNSIEITSNPNKLYTINNEFIFTFDDFVDKTKIIILNPESFDLKTLEFDKPTIHQSEFINHNSYLYDNKIFQIKSSSYSMKFVAKDFNTKKILKEITLNKEDSITFKNTPIIQEGPAFIAGKRTREMEKTSKFLRKVSSGDIGISAYKQNNNYKIVLGSKVEIKTGGGGFSGLPMGGFGPLSVSFNPTFFAYGGYSSSKSTHIDCLFDDNFEHVKGRISENVFDRIKTYEEFFENDIFSKKIKLKNLFRHNKKLYLGYLNSSDRNYHLIEFID